MSEHITTEELKKYYNIFCAGEMWEEDAGFVDEIDAHAAECEQCFERMEAVRLLMRGFSSDPELAGEFLRMEFPQPLGKAPFDIRKVFVGIRIVREEAGGRIQMLADTLSDRMNAVFSPYSPALAASRGNQDEPVGGALNDLLRSDMALPLAEGRQITLKCRKIGNSDQIRLFIYSNFDADFTLHSDGKNNSPARKEFDQETGEYVWVYELDGGMFALTAE